MRKLALIIALPLLTLPGFAQTRNCLRIMPMDEMTRNSILIARVKVHRAEKAKYKGSFFQVAIMRPVDVIEGDFTLKDINVLARSNVRCAEDNYIEAQEMLVFLEPEDSLFHTLNYQYGQFQIVGEIVKGWRDANNKPIDKPYAEVRQEILAYVNAVRSPKPEPTPQPVQPTKPPRPDAGSL
ncbi:MAG TPA: hypothetical protein VNI02_00580 [Blastocatellia bacterium]|jgi:hypothetical protein|nr:hypothetical protein [Blastocatellia bacterium]